MVVKNLPAALIFSASVPLLVGCTEDKDWYDTGYSDGYAVGYNTACEIRATLITGKWDNADYSRGYSEGNTAGTIACNRDRRNR